MGAVGSSSVIWDWDFKYGIEILHKCGKRVEIQIQKVLGANSVLVLITFVEVTRKKLVGGATPPLLTLHPE